MFRKTILLLSLAAYLQFTYSATTASFPSDPALSSELASISSLESAQLSSLATLTSGMPTLPSSVNAYLSSAGSVYAAQFTDQCNFPTTTPDFIATAPAYVKSALTSYGSALSSYEVAHSKGLTVTTTSLTGKGSSTSYSLGTHIPTGTCNGGVASTAKTSPSTKATGTGTADNASATTSSNSTSTATGTSASKSSSAAAPRNGDVILGFAGVFGIVGLMVAL